MGPVSSMCCESDKKSKVEEAPQPTTKKIKPDPSVALPTKK